ncbi:hypothetical protein PYCC9005_005134 [Savitreella phatthalungensis]
MRIQRSHSQSLQLETIQVNKNAIRVDGHDEEALSSTTTPTEPRRETTSHEKDVVKDIRYVEWEANDPENPFNWPARRKAIISSVTIIMTLFVASSAVCFSWIIPSMERDFNVSRIVATIGQVLFTVGFAIAPMALAPLSEVYGRNSVYYSTYGLFVLLFIPLALSPSFAGLLVLRLLSGIFSSTGSTMVGGTLSDMYISQERGRPMALFSSVTLFGTAFGSIVSAYTTQNPKLGWRWVFWIQLIVNAVLFVVLAVVLRETRGTVLLSRRAAMLRKKTGDSRYMARAELERQSLSILIRHSLTRPFRFLFTEPTIMAFSVWVSFVWGVLYLFLAAIPIVFTQVYGATAASSSLGFLGMVVGTTIGVGLVPFLDGLYNKSAIKQPGGQPRPEARLYGSMVASPLFAVGMLMFGWLAYPRIHWVGVEVGVALASFGIFAIYLAVFNYIADNYGTYASSALAAQSFLRNMFASFFPLFSHQMYESLGVHWASTVLGLTGVLLTAVPYILFFYGPAIRARSKYVLSDA